jgi:hypothetical protein
LSRKQKSVGIRLPAGFCFAANVDAGVPRVGAVRELPVPGNLSTANMKF